MGYSKELGGKDGEEKGDCIAFNKIYLIGYKKIFSASESHINRKEI
jgi:hypothetical protein